jgi:hypothetical protein
MEVKLLLGAHIWDFAQHADAFGKRTHELRLPLQHSVPPAPAYQSLLTEIAAIAATGERLGAIYGVMLPAVGRRLRDYRAATDTLLDAPTVRIVDRVLADHERMLGEHRELRQQLPALPAAPPPWLAALSAREQALAAIADPPDQQGAAS